MKQLFIDCGMGAAGDMLTAALYELLDEEGKKRFDDLMAEIVPEGSVVDVRPSIKCGITGSHFDVMIKGEVEHSHDHHEHERTHEHSHEHIHEHEHVHTHEHTHGDGHEHSHEHVHVHSHEHTHEHMHDHDHDHHHHHHHHHDHVHRSMADVENIVNGFGPVSDDVKAKILDVYKIIAAAESEVHGTDVTEIHFHEVGMMDAVIDVTAVCVLMDMISPDRITISPVRVGKGHMRCAHGVLPVPAPAAANILRGIPTYAGNIEGEMCTPTGAALIKYFADDFGDQPVMAVSRIGYGMGTKDFEICNCVRALLSE